MAKFIKLFCVTGLGMLLLCLISCEQKQEPAKIKKQIMVVSKSIDRAENGPAGKSIKQNGGKAKPKSVKSAVKKPLPADSSFSREKKDDTSPALVTAVPPGSMTQERAKQDTVIAQAGLDEPTLRTKSYDTKGRVDPFIPLLSEKKEEAVQPEPEDNKPKRILTPLEKMDLSQIRLVAIIEMKGRSIAMVEEASGKGYEVKLGTYMGRNSGQVSAINETGIVVKDYVRDFKGIRRERLQEIKFHKSEGGE